jgi:hypothetical protein
MAASNWYFLNFFALFAAVSPVHLAKPIEIIQRPLIIIHGLTSSCADSFYQNLATNHNGTCIETGPHHRSLQPYSQMALTGCQALADLVKGDPDRFVNGFYLATLSNGGIVTRHLLLACPLFRKLIRRMIMVGTPHLGTYSFSIQLKQQLRSMWKYKKFAMHYLYNTIVGKHENDVDRIDNIDEKQNNRYIKILAAEETAKRSFDLPQLELWINVSGDHDMIVPHETVMFGANYFLGNDTLVPFSTTPAFQNQYLGLSKLYEEGRYMNCVVEGPHAKFGNKDQEDALFNLLTDNCTFDPNIFGSVRVANLYRVCLKMKVTHSHSFGQLKCDPTATQTYHKHGAHHEIKGLKMSVWRPNLV